MPITALPLTELDAINEMLSTGSESPISTLEDDEVIDSALAQRILRTTSIEVQTRGWFFNTEDAEIAPDQVGHILLPVNLLRIDTSGSSIGVDCTARGTKLWNKTDRTYVFDTAVDVVWTVGLNFEELPSSARVYITVRAARKYQDRYFTDPALHSYTAQDELEAKMALENEHLENVDANMLSDSSFITNLTSR